MTPNIHTIPVGGSEPVHHANPQCWCRPFPDHDEPGVIIHNADDGREKYERQGITEPGQHWILVFE